MVVVMCGSLVRIACHGVIFNTRAAVTPTSYELPNPTADNYRIQHRADAIDYFY